MANSGTQRAIDALADEIGKNIYMDVAKWHLYLSDAHLDKVLAEQFYPMLADNVLSADTVQQVLQNTPIKLGGGKREVPLADLLPMQCQVNLLDLLEEFQRQL